jgi:NAD+ kinase
MHEIRTLGLVLHPRRDSSEAIHTLLAWATARDVVVLGLGEEVRRLDSAAVTATPDEIAARADLLVALGGDGTVLRAMRLSDSHHAPVLGVNLGKLGFLAEVDIPDLNAALTAIDDGNYRIELRSALDAAIGPREFTAFNDIVVARVPGQGSAVVALSVEGHHFVSYAGDAVIVATPTGSTAYNFSAGGPIVAPSVAGILVTPSSPHSVFNRALIVDHRHSLCLRILAPSERLAVEVDGVVATYVAPGDNISVSAREGGARVVRLGHKTFYQRSALPVPRNSTLLSGSVHCLPIRSDQRDVVASLSSTRTSSMREPSFSKDPLVDFREVSRLASETGDLLDPGARDRVAGLVGAFIGLVEARRQ